MEYHAKASPSAAMTKDLANTATSKLMMNWCGSILPLNLGKVMGLQEGGQGEFWIPSDNGDFESMVLWTDGKVYGMSKVVWVAVVGEGLGRLQIDE